MRVLNLTPEEQRKIEQAVLEKVAATTSHTNLLNITVDINKILNTDEKGNQIKPVIYFTPTAYLKMIKLIQTTNDEIGWHGTVERLSQTEFLIYDILVFPQTVTGTNVNPDATEYALWLSSFDDDVFPFIRFHGHSHVNMGVSPSGTDTTWRSDILNQMTNNDYYIFMILNKKHDLECELYDFVTNRLYETADVRIETLLNNNPATRFTDTISNYLRDTSELVKRYKYAAPTPPGKKTEELIPIKVTNKEKNVTHIHPPGIVEGHTLSDIQWTNKWFWDPTIRAWKLRAEFSQTYIAYCEELNAVYGEGGECTYNGPK